MSDSTYTGFSIHWIEEWSQFFQRCNWYTFHPFTLEIEDERNMGGFEISLIVLGLGFRARWNYQETDMVRDIKKKVREIRGEELTGPF